MTLPATAVAHYGEQQRIAIATAAKVDAIWQLGRADDFDLAWAKLAAPIFAAVVAGQTQAAASGLAYVPAVLAEQGVDPTPVATIDPQRFAGGNSDGEPAEYLLGAAPVKAKETMKVAQSSAAAWLAGGEFLTTITLDLVRDANRDATAAGMGVRPDVEGWVRQLNPPSCKACLLLAGKWFRWNQGFQRHPKCDCRHVPGRKASLEGAAVDPYAYFHGLSKAEQDRMFGPTDAQAVRDGADLYRVVNLRERGIPKSGRRGWQARRYGTPSKLTIDDVYQAAGDDRAKAVELMRENGFITGEQKAGGNILGNGDEASMLGAGALGRGGTRVGATRAYRKAVASGVRDPLEPATQTAAERRFHTAFLMNQAVDRGSNPFAANNLRDPLTPQVAALVRRNYRRQVEGLASAPEQVRTLARLLGVNP